MVSPREAEQNESRKTQLDSTRLCTHGINTHIGLHCAAKDARGFKALFHSILVYRYTSKVPHAALSDCFIAYLKKCYMYLLYDQNKMCHAFCTHLPCVLYIFQIALEREKICGMAYFKSDPIIGLVSILLCSSSLKCTYTGSLIRANRL